MNQRILFQSSCALVGIAVFAACGDSGGENPEDPNAAQRRELLVSATDQVIVPGFENFASDAASLASAVEAWAVDVAAGATADRTSVDTAFVEAYRSMQYAEVLQIGPYGAASEFEGGLNIRDEVYSWPASNPCRVDQETASGDYSGSDFFSNSLVNVYGFDTLEYLLYAPDTGNRCAVSAPLNTSGDWSSLTEDEVVRRRAEYASAVANEISRRAAEVRDAWRNGFADNLKSAGSSGSTYSTTQEGLDAIFASMFYAEQEVKDQKLARPLGIAAECREETCPEFVESQFARISRTALEANLQAFADLYRGGPDTASNRVGFGELLRSIGADELANTLDQQLVDAFDRLPAVVDPLQDILTSAPPRELHTSLGTLMTTVKTQFVGVLSLRVPNEGAADND